MLHWTAQQSEVSSLLCSLLPLGSHIPLGTHLQFCNFWISFTNSCLFHWLLFEEGEWEIRVGKKFVLQTKCVTIIWPINSKYCISLSMVASNRFLVLLGKSCFTKTAYYVNTFLPNIHIMETKTRKIILKAFLKFIQFPTEFQVPNSL